MIDSWTKGRLIVRDWESLRGRDKGRQQRCWYVSSVSWAQDLVRALEYNDPIAIRAPKLVVLGRPVVAYHTD